MPCADWSRNTGGVPPKLRGKRLELLLRQTAKSLAALGVARIYDWPVRQIAQRATIKCPQCHHAHAGWEAVFVQKTGYDFFGFSLSGRFIAIEAKECVANRLPLNVQKGHGLKAHQVDALLEVHRAGGSAIIVWMHGEEVAVCPVGKWLDRKVKSLSWKDAQKWRYPWDKERGILGLVGLLS